MCDESNGDFYRRALRRHGTGPKAVGWTSGRAQADRFRIIDEAVDLDGARILDVGCGLGALYDYLAARGRRIDYVGIDAVPGMVSRARAMCPEGEFRATSLEGLHAAAACAPHSFDYVVASGIFARRADCSMDTVLRTAEVMFGLCRRAVVFNSLSARSPRNARRGFAIDPADALPGLMEITPALAMSHHPRIGDVSFVLRRLH